MLANIKEKLLKSRVGALIQADNITTKVQLAFLTVLAFNSPPKLGTRCHIRNMDVFVVLAPVAAAPLGQLPEPSTFLSLMDGPRIAPR